MDNRYLILADSENPSPNTLNTPLKQYKLNISPKSSNKTIHICQKHDKPKYTAYAFFKLVKDGDEKGVEDFLNFINPNISFKGNTILNHAIYYNQYNITEMILKKGANPFKKSIKYNMDAFDEAKDKPEIYNILKQYGDTKVDKI